MRSLFQKNDLRLDANSLSMDVTIGELDFLQQGVLKMEIRMVKRMLLAGEITG